MGIVQIELAKSDLGTLSENERDKSEIGCRQPASDRKPIDG